MGWGHAWGQMGLKSNLTLLPLSWVTSGNLLNLSEPRSPIKWVGASSPTVNLGLSQLMYVKCLLGTQGQHHCYQREGLSCNSPTHACRASGHLRPFTFLPGLPPSPPVYSPRVWGTTVLMEIFNEVLFPVH